MMQVMCQQFHKERVKNEQRIKNKKRINIKPNARIKAFLAARYIAG
jgi:hypothetical protein